VTCPLADAPDRLRHVETGGATREGRIVRHPYRQPGQGFEAGQEALGLAQRHPEHCARGSAHRIAASLVRLPLPPVARQPDSTAAKVQRVTSPRDTRARLYAAQFVTRYFDFVDTVAAKG